MNSSGYAHSADCRKHWHHLLLRQLLLLLLQMLRCQWQP
jgi:hypothetical protein